MRRKRTAWAVRTRSLVGTQWEQGTPSLKMPRVPEVKMQFLGNLMESRSNEGCLQQRQLSKKSMSYKWFGDWQNTLERNHCMPAFLFCSFLCIHLLILPGDRILCQIIWAQITWSNTSRLSHTWWSQLCNEIMFLAHSKQLKVRIICLRMLSHAGVVLTSVVAQLTPLELHKPHKLFPCFLP